MLAKSRYWEVVGCALFGMAEACELGVAGDEEEDAATHEEEVFRQVAAGCVWVAPVEGLGSSHVEAVACVWAMGACGLEAASQHPMGVRGVEGV